MKKIFTTILGVVLSVAIIILLFTGVVFHEYLEAIGSIIAIIGVLVLIPALLVEDYLKKKKRIEYLEKILREHNIDFSYDR